MKPETEQRMDNTIEIANALTKKIEEKLGGVGGYMGFAHRKAEARRGEVESAILIAAAHITAQQVDETAAVAVALEEMLLKGKTGNWARTIFVYPLMWPLKLFGWREPGGVLPNAIIAAALICKESGEIDPE